MSGIKGDANDVVSCLGPRVSLPEYVRDAISLLTIKSGERVGCFE